MMKLAVVCMLVAAAAADVSLNSYLPPSARTAGGSGSFLTAPKPAQTTSFGPGIATSYRAPPSGPATPSRLYDSPSYSRSSVVPAAILRSNNENNGDGSYRFEYQTENKISQQEEGHLENAGSNQESSVVHGSYSYEAPDGQTITVQYVADENGFRASGDHIPTSPPIPAAIQKSLENNAAATRTAGFPASSSSTVGASSTSLQGGLQQEVGRQYLAPVTRQPSGNGYRY